MTVAAALLLAVALDAFGHPGHLPPGALGRWTWAPFVEGWLLLCAAFYAAGAARLRRRDRRAVRAWEIGCFAAGWAVIVLALVSPLDAVSDTLFSAHMAQHELLMVVAAPLIVLGRPGVAYLWALPARLRTRVGVLSRAPVARAGWRIASAPLVVFLVHGLVLWVWHLPRLYEACLHDEAIHGVQHFTFFATAALFYWSLLQGRYGRLAYGAAALYVFATTVHGSLLGALAAASRAPWYPTHAARTEAAGFDAIGDQRLAGILMWIPAGSILLVLGLVLVAAWLRESERRARYGSVT